MDFTIGQIIAWRLAQIPEGWRICDGTNGTPNLIGRFIRGASADGQLGMVSGADTHTNSYPATATSTRAAHPHSTGGDWSLSGISSDKAPSSTGIIRAANHRHTAPVSIGSGGGHPHPLAATDVASNLPKHIRLVFIMKVE